MLRLVLAASLLTLPLGGCATSYKSKGFSGGFDETALAPNMYRVSFRGNAYTGEQRAEELALLRSADLTLQKGFKFFALADSSNAARVSMMTTPETTTTMGNMTTFGNSAQFNAQSTTTGGEPIFLSKPTTTNIVVMFTDRPQLPGMVFDAAFLCASVGPKYKATCGVK